MLKCMISLLARSKLDFGVGMALEGTHSADVQDVLRFPLRVERMEWSKLTSFYDKQTPRGWFKNERVTSKIPS